MPVWVLPFSLSLSELVYPVTQHTKGAQVILHRRRSNRYAGNQQKHDNHHCEPFELLHLLGPTSRAIAGPGAAVCKVSWVEHHLCAALVADRGRITAARGWKLLRARRQNQHAVVRSSLLRC